MRSLIWGFVRLYLALLLIVLSFGLVTPGFAAERLLIVTEEAPPSSMKDKSSDKIIGISTDIVRSALEAEAIDYLVNVYSWARALEMAKVTDNACVYAVNRTAQRENQFKWVGPFYHDGWALIGRPDSPKLISLEDARRSVLGGYFGDAATDYLIKQGFKVELVSDQKLNAKKLQAHRIDYWINGVLSAPYIARQVGSSDLAPVLVFKEVQLYMACNKNIADSTIDRLNSRMRVFAKNGVIEKFAGAYR